MNFVERCIAGLVKDYDEEIDDAISDWHNGDSQLNLHEFLGLSWEEHSSWVKNSEMLPVIIDSKLD